MKKDNGNNKKRNKYIVVAVILIAILIVIAILQVINRKTKWISTSTKSNAYKVGTTYNISHNKVFSLTSSADFKDLAIKNANMKESAAKEEDEALIAQVKEIEDIKSFVKNNDKKTVYNAIIGNEGSVDIPEVVVTVNKNDMKTNNVQLPVSLLYQLPELPTGCETTSLTTVLNYLGYNVDKCTIADNFLPKCGLGEGSFWNYFLGDPRDEYSLGCYAGPIVTAANTYLATQGNNHTAHNYSDSSFTTLLQQVEAGYPVILWSTMDLKEARMTLKWEVDGQMIQWTILNIVLF